MTRFAPALPSRLATTIAGHIRTLALHAQQITTLQSQAAVLNTVTTTQATQIASTNSTVASQGSDIAANTSDIATNTSDISTLSSDIPSNASFLETLNVRHPASKAVALSDSHMPTATSSYNQSDTQGAYNRINDLIDYVNELAGNLNDLYDALEDTNIID